MSDETPMAEHHTETLLQALVYAATKMVPDLPVTDSEPVWEFQSGPETPLTEAQIKNATEEELPFFFLVRNAWPVLVIYNHGDSKLEAHKLDLTYEGDPELDPRRIYDEIDSEVG